MKQYGEKDKPTSTHTVANNNKRQRYDTVQYEDKTK